MGGLNIFVPSEISDLEYTYSKMATLPLIDMIREQKIEYDLDSNELFTLNNSMKAAKCEISVSKQKFYLDKVTNIKSSAPKKVINTLQKLSRKGTSSWLTTLPLEEFNFILNKSEFVDALCLRYNHEIKNIPKVCACGKSNSLDHSLVCSKGGFVHLRHNQIRDLEIKMLQEVCYDVKKEPVLLPLTGETLNHKSANRAPDARADISCRSVYNNLDKVLFDVRCFHDGAASNENSNDAFKKHEDEKKRTYNQRILEVEKA